MSAEVIANLNAAAVVFRSSADYCRDCAQPLKSDEQGVCAQHARRFDPAILEASGQLTLRFIN